MARGAEGIVRALRDAGVEVVFGIPGIHNLPLYEALRRDGTIRHILCRHECGAVHMADGYARAGRRVGVALTTTGPGVGLTVAAMQEAWGSCSPVLLIASNIESDKIGRGLGALHELEGQGGLLRTVTKKTFAVAPGDDLYDLTQRALQVALSGRPGPVYVDVPTDLLVGAASAEGGSTAQSPSLEQDLSGLTAAVEMLRQARQPVILSGSAAVAAGLGENIRTLAETLSAPIFTNSSGKGVIPEDHPLSFGHIARRGVVREMVGECDVAVVIGSRLREVDAKRRGLALPADVIHVDWDRSWVGKNFPTTISLVGDIGSVTRELVQHVGFPSPPPHRRPWLAQWRERLSQEWADIRRTATPVAYLEAIRNQLPRDGILVVDNTMLGYWAEYFFPTYVPGGFLAAKGSGLLGFSLPAAIGAKVACPGKTVVALMGDGGFLYTAQELATAVRYRVGFPLIVVNDNAYGVIGYLQKSTYGEEYQVDLTNPDFPSFAASFGMAATQVSSPPDLARALEKALTSEGPWLIECQAAFPEPPFARY